MDVPLREATILSFRWLQITNPVVTPPLEFKGAPGVTEFPIHSKCCKAQGVVVESNVFDELLVFKAFLQPWREFRLLNSEFAIGTTKALGFAGEFQGST